MSMKQQYERKGAAQTVVVKYKWSSNVRVQQRNDSMKQQYDYEEQ